MTKSELLNWLEQQSFCEAIIADPTLIDEKADGTRWYSVTIREVYENTATCRNLFLYVIHEQENDETAYWKDQTPTAILGNQTALPTYKMVTFRTIIDAIGEEMANTMITKLKAAASQNAVIEQAYKMLETYGPDGGIDINSENTQATIQSLVTSNILTQSEADAVIGLADTAECPHAI